MAAEFTGGGDPGRSIALLWGVAETGRRGPKPRHTVEDVVQAAISLADAEGLAALSMRRVAETLQLSAMSLYTYVPSKAELIDLMLDRAHGELADELPATGWRDAVTAVAEDLWQLYHRHPWLLQVTVGRPPLGPNTFAKYERELTALDGLGLTDLELDAVVSLVTGFVRGTARGSVDAARVVRRSGLTDL